MQTLTLDVMLFPPSLPIGLVQHPASSFAFAQCVPDVVRDRNRNRIHSYHDAHQHEKNMPLECEDGPHDDQYKAKRNTHACVLSNGMEKRKAGVSLAFLACRKCQ